MAVLATANISEHVKGGEPSLDFRIIQLWNPELGQWEGAKRKGSDIICQLNSWGKNAESVEDTKR